MDVLHVVRTFGDKNQPYTTNLLNKFNSIGNLKYTVASDLIHTSSEKIKVYSVSSQVSKIQLANIPYLIKCFFNSSLKEVLTGLSLKKKVKFLVKWKNLILSNPKVIHLHHMQVFDFPILSYLKAKKIPIICSLRGRDILINTRSEDGRKTFEKYINSFDHIHVISSFLEEKLLEFTDKKELTVVHRGGNQPLPQHIKKEFIIDRTEIIKAIVVGRLVWEKGHFYILDSIKRLRDEGYNISVDIYGDGPLFEFLEYRITQLQLEDVIQLKGYIENNILQKKYHEYDISIQPSLSEALSNGLLDLTFHNIPCVVSNVGGMPEIIEDGVNGVVYDVNNVGAIDEAIVKAFNLDFHDLCLYNETLKKHFSLENEIKGLETIYNKYID